MIDIVKYKYNNDEKMMYWKGCGNITQEAKFNIMKRKSLRSFLKRGLHEKQCTGLTPLGPVLTFFAVKEVKMWSTTVFYKYEAISFCEKNLLLFITYSTD